MSGERISGIVFTVNYIISIKNENMHLVVLGCKPDSIMFNEVN